MKGAEQFACVYSEDKDAGGKVVSKRTLFGQEAVNYRFAHCKQVVGLQDTTDLKLFQMYSWMLTEAQHAEFLVWEQTAVKGAKQRQVQDKAKALQDISDSINAEKKKKRGSASTESQVVVAPPLKLLKPDTAKAGKMDTNIDAHEASDEEHMPDAGLLSFFGSKAL